MKERPPILPPALGLLAMLGVFAAHFIQPLIILLPHPYNFVALIPISLGAMLNIMAERELVLRDAIEPHDRAAPSKLLVTTGVYRYSRNPAYLGLLLIVIGLAMWVGSLSPWIVVVLFVGFLSRVYIKKEETALAAQFGDPYDVYTNQTPRWFGVKQSNK